MPLPRIKALVDSAWKPPAGPTTVQLLDESNPDGPVVGYDTVDQP